MSRVKQTILWSVWGGMGVGASLQDVLSLILEHVSVMGWDACCWSDESLASKKIYPKYQFPAKSKKWLPRATSSEDSMRMLVQRVQATHEKASRLAPQKLDTSTLEGLAERAAVVESMGKEVQQTVPLSNEVLEKEWWGPWAAGSEHIDTEVRVHLLDKSETFLPAQHIPTLKIWSTPTCSKLAPLSSHRIRRTHWRLMSSRC